MIQYEIKILNVLNGCESIACNEVIFLKCKPDCIISSHIKIYHKFPSS